MDPPERGALVVGEVAREVLQEEVARLLRRLPDEEREELAALALAIGQGRVPADQLAVLERLLWLLLESGLARERHHAEGEQALRRLFLTTPRGRALAGEFEELNRALRALRGQTVSAVTVSIGRPGRYLLSIETEGLTLTLQASREGFSLESVTV